MTEEQAALCVQAYWRRFLSVIYYQESRGAAITVQVRRRVVAPRRPPPLATVRPPHPRGRPLAMQQPNSRPPPGSAHRRLRFVG